MENENVFGKNTSDVLHDGFPLENGKQVRATTCKFTENERQDIWREQISQKGQTVERTVYIHIPFCRFRCVYCPFFRNFGDQSQQADYVKNLLEDFKLSGQAAYCHSQPIKAVYFGGGTPGILNANQITQLLDCIKSNLTLAPDCEITFETSLSDLDDHQLAACLAGGVNRFSLGVQTFNTQIRRALGRPDDENKIRMRLEEIATKQTQAAVVIDLLYGLPGQTRELWQYDLEVATASGIHGLDMYRLNVIPSLSQAIQKGRIKPVPSRAQQADYFVQAVEYLSRAGMRRLSICHWGRYDLKERNVYNRLGKGYAGRIPFGAGGGGNLDGYRVSLESSINEYINNINRKLKPVKVIEYPPDYYYEIATMRGMMDQGLIQLHGLSLTDGRPLEDIFEPLLQVWEHKGFINRIRGMNEMTLAGQFWAVELQNALLEYFQRCCKRKVLT